MSCYDARNLAANQGMDLVLISNQGNVPVCKIMDYGKFKYEQVKKAKEAKKTQRVVEIKEVWLSPTIDVGDMNTKAKNATKFITAGDRVKVGIRMRGRQNARPEIALKVMEVFVEMLKEIAVVEKAPNLEGRVITMMLSPINKK